MRISDWSSDVCSSDLAPLCCQFDPQRPCDGRRPENMLTFAKLNAEMDAQGLEIEGPTDDLKTLRWFLGCCKTSSQWTAFTSAAWVNGRRHWRPTEQLRNLAETRPRSEEHTSELQSLMRISYAVL